MSSARHPGLRVLALDRDGVLNRDLPTGVRFAEELVWLPGALEAVSQASRAGWLVAVVTNQANIGRGLLSRRALDEFHERLITDVRALGGEVHGVFVCPHRPEDNCACRKPRAGLLEDMAASFEVVPSQCLMVGDDLRDAQAASAFGCAFARVLTGKGRSPAWEQYSVNTYANLAALVGELINV